MTKRTLLLALVLFLVNLFLVYPSLTPGPDDINPFDESVYIHGGQTLLDKGTWAVYSSNPLVDVFYALTYLPFHNSPYWFVQSGALGRLLLFILVWWSAFLVATQIADFAPPLVAAGLLLVMPLTTEMLSFPSDPLFAGLAGLSFWQLLAYYRERRLRSLWLASLFMGLAAMARNDGLFSFAILVVLTLVIYLNQNSPRPNLGARQGVGLIMSLTAVSLPFVAIVAGYILVYGLFTGNYDPGTMRRTYDNFEAGQEVIYSGTGNLNTVTESKLEARKAFGTPAENDYSVFNAIRRNPRVYLQRLAAALKALPNLALHAYGIRLAPVLFLLALRGLLALWLRRKYLLLVMLVSWPAHLLTGVAITLYREGHLLFPFYVVFTLAAVGLAALLESITRFSQTRASSGLQNMALAERLRCWIAEPAGREMLGWTGILVLVGAAALLGEKPAFYYSSAIFLGALWLVYLWQRLQEPNASRLPAAPTALLILLVAGIILRGGFPGPSSASLGQSGRQEAAIYLMNNLPADSTVASASPGPVWMAKMTYQSLIATDVPRDKSPEQFLEWMKEQGITAVYVDGALYHQNPAVWALIEPQIGKGIQRAFSGDNGDVQILLLRQ